MIPRLNYDEDIVPQYEALAERYVQLTRKFDPTYEPSTVVDLLNALDARGDQVSVAAANLIRRIGVEAPDLVDIENAEL